MTQEKKNELIELISDLSRISEQIGGSAMFSSIERLNELEADRTITIENILKILDENLEISK